MSTTSNSHRAVVCRYLDLAFTLRDQADRIGDRAAAGQIHDRANRVLNLATAVATDTRR